MTMPPGIDRKRLQFFIDLAQVERRTATRRKHERPTV